MNICLITKKLGLLSVSDNGGFSGSECCQNNRNLSGMPWKKGYQSTWVYRGSGFVIGLYNNKLKNVKVILSISK